MMFSYICVLYIGLVSYNHIANVNAQVTLQSNNVMPTQGNSLTLSCLIQAVVSDNAITWYVPKSIRGIATCYRQSGFCTGSAPGYTYTANQSGAYLEITSINRDQDEGTWKCGYRGSDGLDTTRTLNITVYTLPSQLVYTKDVQAPTDLTVSNLSLQCKTSSCTYPPPVIKWYYKTQTSPIVSGEYLSGIGMTSSVDSCSSQEKIYTCTLQIPLYTTWSDNSDKNVIFFCRIEYPDPLRNIKSADSGTVRFAVRVSQVELQQNSQPIPDTVPLNVNSGEQVTLTCIPGTSRPAPTIDWYIEMIKMSSGTSPNFTFTPVNENHNKTIFCQAYNTDPVQAVDSKKPRLYVRVRVTQIELQQKNLPIPDTVPLNVTSGEQVTLTCIQGTSRPDPTIDWYIGTNKMSSGTSQSLTFTPRIDDHDKTIFCRAYNTDPVQAVDSKKPRLYVRVAVTSVTLSISASEVVFYEGYPQMMTCISSQSRPLSTIRWFLGSRLLTDNITTTNTTDVTGLYILTSQIFLTLMKNDSSQQIWCEGFIDGQQAVTSGRKPSINVWYKPSKPMVREYGGASSGFPWLENMTGTLQCYSSDYGNPGANVTWLSDRGVMDSMNNLVIIGLMPSDDKRNISCKLVNRFTSDKNIDVLSDPVMLNVEYHPVIKYNTSTHLIINETQSISVSCETVGNPYPQSVQWKNSLDGSTLRFDNISRMDTGTYICEATANSTKYGTLTAQKQIDIIVQYAPDVKVTFTGSNQQNQTARLICEAEGFPAQYTFNAWIHMWEDTVIRTGLLGVTSASQSTLIIDRLSLESMGTYVCTANNGISGINGHVKQIGSGNLTVTGMPNILDNSTLFHGEISMSINISIPLYSNPVIESFVILRNGTEIINNSRTMTRLTWDLANYTLYGIVVKLKAQKAHLIIQNLTPGDFDNYTLELRNSVGRTVFRFQLDAFGPPFKVLRFYFNRLIDNQIELHFDPGFNGGYSQTFVIEEKSAAVSSGAWQNTSVTDLLETEWQNQFRNGTFFVSITKPVIPGIYQYRMYSWNVKGKSQFSEIITVTVLGVPPVYESPETSVAGIAGGISTGIVIILGAVIGIFLWRRYQHTKKNENDKDINREHKERTRQNQTSTNSLKQDAASGEEYEGLHFRDAEVNQYLQLNVLTSDNKDQADKRSPDGDSYEKLHPYANNGIQMYSSLKIPETNKDSQKDYENAWIKA